MQGCKVLVVDDHAAICTIVRRFLVSVGADVTDVRNGYDALHAVLNGAFDLVIADIEMPELGGIDMTKCLRHVERTREIPIMIISAQDTDSDREAALAAGADVFLSKPFSKEELIAAATALLQKKSSGA